ncbi:hypothetical protein GE061_019167 [Apolygus lucorum]|uniref:Uncharacterized protein n=1 Tax=Apolygus lucorum TaxID=248454 RepID=A0A6A4JNQ3_APOLU|nr:hypothetical protein GE061_019167 [Apolygus lucorum]
MRLVQVVLLVLAVVPALAQEGGGFELPVQLIGFPIIIIAVRIANFLKKLTYALNPNTYRSRNKRGALTGPDNIDVGEVEKRLVAEMGQGVCIYERICSSYATRAPAGPSDIDWNDMFRKFSTYPRDMGENYVLSVFLGDIVGSVAVCHGLAKRGRDCESRGRGVYPVPLPSLPSPVAATLPSHLATVAPPPPNHIIHVFPHYAS